MADEARAFLKGIEEANLNRRQRLRSAEEHGSGSEAAQRFRLMQFLGWFGQQVNHRRRRPRVELSLTGDSLIGEARQASGWMDFSVDLATGEVRFGDAVAAPKSVE